MGEKKVNSRFSQFRNFADTAVMLCKAELLSLSKTTATA